MIYAIAAMVVAGAAGLAALVVSMLQRQSYKLGAQENHNVEQAKADEGKNRANTVLLEHREPDTATDRLRDGNF